MKKPCLSILPVLVFAIGLTACKKHKPENCYAVQVFFRPASVFDEPAPGLYSLTELTLKGFAKDTAFLQEVWNTTTAATGKVSLPAAEEILWTFKAPEVQDNMIYIEACLGAEAPDGKLFLTEWIRHANEKMYARQVEKNSAHLAEMRDAIDSLLGQLQPYYDPGHDAVAVEKKMQSLLHDPGSRLQCLESVAADVAGGYYEVADHDKVRACRKSMLDYTHSAASVQMEIFKAPEEMEQRYINLSVEIEDANFSISGTLPPLEMFNTPVRMPY